MSIKVGIFFGGPSREREISFAGGRTVYDNLNKSLFEAVPIFVDSFRNWYLLDWEYLYKGSIRDFFPPVDELPASPNGFQVYQESLGPLAEADFTRMASTIGRRIPKYELNELIDVAFLALHGVYGEDGVLQAELDKLGMPYTGSGVKASEIGMDKALQKELMAAKGFPTPAIEVINRSDFFKADVTELFDQASAKIGWPLVIRPANQGSSIGVSIIDEAAGLAGFELAVNRAFFREIVPLTEWLERDDFDRLEYVRFLSDIRDGLGYPLDVIHQEHRLTMYHPEELLTYFQEKAAADPQGIVTLEGHQQEERVILEAFIRGKEFSTIVMRTEDGKCVALPPTEIVKGGEVFDYRSKYLPGLSRKVTPINLPTENIQQIRQECERLFTDLGFGTYARIDGFFADDGQVFLNDPNTTSGMLPSSFFFHQAAEIGLNPSQFLTYILRVSLQERAAEGNEFASELMQQLDASVVELRNNINRKRKIAVLLGGSSFERHISVESGRNVFEKLASSDKYAPIPVFLTAPEATTPNKPEYVLYQLPINLLLKDNADDIRDKVLHFKDHPILAEIRNECRGITTKYAGEAVVFAPQSTNWDRLANNVDGVFIALHGRPGEDGQVQMQLEARSLPYNGSGVSSSSLTINKYRTLQTLKEAGMSVADQWLATKQEFLKGESAFYDKVEDRFGYPLIAKPVDDGCSSAVKVIKGRDELHAYSRLMFMVDDLDEVSARKELRLKAKEEFPVKEEILFEELITAKGATKFLEITGGMLTAEKNGHCYFEVFEPSETLAGGEILSLEEKFLAGEGQNLTPARFATDRYDYDHVASQVKNDLLKAAKLLGIRGYCRIDAFVRIFADGRAETLVIEANSLPGMTPATAIFHQAAIAGYQPYQFIDHLLEYGFARNEKGALPLFGETPIPAVAPMAAATTRVAAPLAATQAIKKDMTEYNEPPVYTKPSSHDNDYPAAGNQPAWKRGLNAVTRLLKNQYFWRNIGVLFASLLLGFLLLKGCLNVYTNHGQAIELPNFEDKTTEEALRIAKDRGLKLKIQQGPFDPVRKPGLVILQQPKAGNKVKRNRSIYLTVLSDKAPMVALPSLIGKYDYDQYVRELGPRGISYYIADQVYDPKQEENTILHLFLDEQKITDEDIRKGIKIPQGSRLGFVVTVRRTGEVEVPDIICQRFSTAAFVVSGTSLVVGKVYDEDVDSRDNAFVVKTEPAAGSMLEVGKSVTIYLSDSRPDNCE